MVMVYCIGLTGNIASGKSTVALLFNQLGVPIFNADSVSRQITLKGTKAYNKIMAHFGPSVVTKEEALDRKKIRNIIFSNPQERIWLEHLMHPIIRQQLKKEIASCTGPYCIVEIPLLKDKKGYPYINRILVVTSPIELQVQRIITRDQCTEAQAWAIIATQPSIEERIKNADDILENNSGANELKQAVKQLHLNYLKLAKNMTN